MRHTFLTIKRIYTENCCKQRISLLCTYHRTVATHSGTRVYYSFYRANSLDNDSNNRFRSLSMVLNFRKDSDYNDLVQSAKIQNMKQNKLGYFTTNITLLFRQIVLKYLPDIRFRRILQDICTYSR